MGVRITSQEDKVALFDSVTDTAFGPVFDSEDDASLFLDWWAQDSGDGRDLRMLTPAEVEAAVGEWSRRNEVYSQKQP